MSKAKNITEEHEHMGVLITEASNCFIAATWFQLVHNITEGQGSYVEASDKQDKRYNGYNY